MTAAIELPSFSDTLRYRVQVRRSLQQEEVRISVNVRALVHTRDNDQTALERKIHEALNAFVPARWLLSRIERGGEAVGYERVQLVAVARVGSAENYNLAERARQASREGLSLENPRADYGLSLDTVDRLVTEMRYEVVRQVSEHIAGFSRETGRAWSLGDIGYGMEHLASAPSQRTSKGAYRDTEDLLAQLDHDYDENSLSGAERITLVATVTLKAEADARSPWPA